MIKINPISIIEGFAIVAFSFLAYYGKQKEVASWCWIVFTVAVMLCSYISGYCARLVREQYKDD